MVRWPTVISVAAIMNEGIGPCRNGAHLRMKLACLNLQQGRIHDPQMPRATHLRCTFVEALELRGTRLQWLRVVAHDVAV
jgi:hypothetical protein